MGLMDALDVDKAKEKEALEILRKINEREIIINPNVELWISDEVADCLRLYRNRKTTPLSKAFTNRVFTIYDVLVSRGLIDTDAEKESLKKEILRLRKELEAIEKANKPDDAYTSEVTRE